MYLVAVPVPFLFGSIVVLNMLENSLFGRMAQPVKGVLNVLTAIVLGTVLSMIFRMLMPAVSGAQPSGAPTYAAQLWLANALLAVTFPFLVIHAAFFNFWPLRNADVTVSQSQPELS
jgi:chromate transport protein ChrA